LGPARGGGRFQPPAAWTDGRCRVPEATALRPRADAPGARFPRTFGEDCQSSHLFRSVFIHRSGLSSKSLLPREMLCFLNFALRFFRYWTTCPTGVLYPEISSCFTRKLFSTAKSWSLPSLSCKQSRRFSVFPSRLGFPHRCKHPQ
jgi:hypothetical protein